MTNKENNKRRGHNEGSVFRLPNGKWRAMFSLPDGKRISTVFSSKVEGHKWLGEQMHADHSQVNRPQDITPVTIPQSVAPQVQSNTAQDVDNQQTLEEYLNLWFKTHQSGLKPTTQSDYRRIVYKYIIPALGDQLLVTLRRSVFDKFYGDLLDQGMGKTYIIYIHRVLRKALEDAVDDRLLTYNPSSKAKLPRIDRKNHRRSPLTIEETNRLLQTAMETPLGPLIYTAVKTGLRQGELFALQWDDIDWDQRQLHVRRNVQRVKTDLDSKASLVFSSPKSTSGNRVINIGSQTLQMFQKQMENVAHLRFLVGDRWQEYHLVFPSNVGTPRNPSNFIKTYHEILESAGVPKITFHDLRHMAASIMLNNGVPALVVSHILGHAKTSTTINMYGHEFTLQEVQAAEMMDQIIPLPQQAYKVDTISAIIIEPH